MSKIAVITDSNAHITPQEAEKLGISVVPMPFMIGDETFYEGITLSREEFYAKMESGANIVTSQPSRDFLCATIGISPGAASATL